MSYAYHSCQLLSVSSPVTYFYPFLLTPHPFFTHHRPSSRFPPHQRLDALALVNVRCFHRRSTSIAYCFGCLSSAIAFLTTLISLSRFCSVTFLRVFSALNVDRIFWYSDPEGSASLSEDNDISGTVPDDSVSKPPGISFPRNLLEWMRMHSDFSVDARGQSIILWTLRR